MKTRTAAAAALAMLVLPTAQARGEDDIGKNLISNPNVGSWLVYGPETSRKFKDPTVQGGSAVEVKLATVPEHPWTVAAQTTVTGRIAKGDKVVGAVWLKADTGSDAPAKLTMRIQVNADPWPALTEGDIDVGKDWQMYSLDTVADKDYAKGSTVLVLHLGSAKQTIDLGPGFVLDMGPDK
jgi:hypothetical protein